jgi:Amt family ammonium transporter
MLCRTCRSPPARSSVVFFEWVFWGASLTFSRGGSPFIGNLDNFFLIGMDIQPSTGSDFIPQLL